MINDVREDAVLDAAEKAFTMFGARRVTMSDIADSVGMSRPALYLHFKDRQDILQKVVHRIHNSMLAGVRDALIADGSLKNQVYTALKHREGTIYDRSQNCGPVPWFLDKKHQDLAAIINNADDTYFDLLFNHLADNRISADQAKRLARLCIALAIGLRTMSGNRTAFDYQLKASIEQIFEGVSAAPEPVTKGVSWGLKLREM